MSLSRFRFPGGALLALILTGCLSSDLFESEDTVEFPVFVSGSPQRVSGAWVVQESNSPTLSFSRTYNDPPVDTFRVGRLFPSRFVIPQTPYALELNRDTTWGVHFYTQPDPVTGISGDVKVWRGFPCRLSRAVGYQWGPDGTGDTIRVVFSGARVERGGDSLRVILAIDTGASRAADPRVDFSPGAWIYGRATARCPDI
jgi:hypothetical protein